MAKEIVIKTIRKTDSIFGMSWMQFCEEIGVDHVAPSINIAILTSKCSSN